MIDKQRIESLFSELNTYLKDINELSHLSEKEYLSNNRNIYSGRYLLLSDFLTSASGLLTAEREYH